MADGVRRIAGVDVGVGITGIAGPTGGSEAKPVGTVAIAVSGPHGTRVRTYRFPGGRTQVKFFASQSALDMLRRAMADDRADPVASAAPPAGTHGARDGDQWTVTPAAPAPSADIVEPRRSTGRDA
jgi:hypothetical protein